MNDRELLESAARAIGCHGAKYEDGSWLEIRYGYKVAMYHDNLDSYWNPLEDSGDAYRLARELKLTVDFNSGEVRDPRGELLAVSNADIRIAITRAAAAMGMRLDAQSESIG
jgi:hypothetical protein